MVWLMQQSSGMRDNHFMRHNHFCMSATCSVPACHCTTVLQPEAYKAQALVEMVTVYVAQTHVSVLTVISYFKLHCPSGMTHCIALRAAASNGAILSLGGNMPHMSA